MTILRSEGSGDASTGFYKSVIDQSLRFEDGDSAYLLRTPLSSGNRRTFTISFWIKIANLDLTANIISVFQSASPNQQVVIRFYQNLLYLYDFGGAYLISTKRKFRDTTNWYHIAYVVDTTQSTDTNRIKLYVNGIRETDLNDTSYPIEDHETLWNHTNKHLIGARTDNSTPTPIQRLDGYLAEFNLVDGTAIGETSRTGTGMNATEYVLDEFGQFNNGIWTPKAYSGSYGTNGFRLTFEATGTGTTAEGTDNSSNMTNIGDDKSGQGHNFSRSGLLGTDVVKDSPTNNFPTMNFLNTNSNLNLSEGSLKIIPANTSDYYRAMSTMAVPTSGKWYWEIRLFVASYVYQFGLYDVESPTNQRARTVAASVTSSTNDYQVRTSNSLGIDISTEGSAFSDWLSTNIADENIISFAYDADNNKMWFALNGVFKNTSGTANPATGTDPRFSSMASTEYYIGANMPNPASGGAMFNFGQDGSFAGALTGGNVGTATDGNGKGAFKYAPPSGYLALCSANLPDPTIGPQTSTQADDHFNTVLYTGDGQTTQDVTGVGFKPDFTWIKERNSTSGNVLADSSRGYENFLSSQATTDESTGILNNNASRSNDGFQTTNSGASNESGKTYVSWNWKANGGTTTTNDASATSVGTIDSVIQANQTAGFSIITYTGTGTAGTIAHGLGATPSLLLTKNRTWDHEYSAWLWWHHERDNAFASSTNYAYLNLSSSGGTSTTAFYRGDQINSTVFGVYTNDAINDASYNYVTWAWAEIDGYSKMGIYSGNADDDGAFVFTGFRPAWVIIKRTDYGQVGNWFIMDNKRIGYNGANYRLLADGSNEEYTGTSSNIVDFLSNGFKARTTSTNTNDGTYMYMAFAVQPFKFSNAR